MGATQESHLLPPPAGGPTGDISKLPDEGTCPFFLPSLDQILDILAEWRTMVILRFLLSRTRCQTVSRPPFVEEAAAEGWIETLRQNGLAWRSESMGQSRRVSFFFGSEAVEGKPEPDRRVFRAKRQGAARCPACFRSTLWPRYGRAPYVDRIAPVLVDSLYRRMEAGGRL